MHDACTVGRLRFHMAILVGTLMCCSVVFAAPASVTIVSAADATQCLGVKGRQVAPRNCEDGEGVAWYGSVTSLQSPGLLSMLAIETSGGEVAQVRRLVERPSECFRFEKDHFMLWPCEQTKTQWQWDPSTMQLMTGGKCLAYVRNGGLNLEECARMGTSSSGAGRGTDQNGYGAPAEQTWVLMPTIRPQVDQLDTIKFPLFTWGRYLGDSDGVRVKLVGVNWDQALSATATDSLRKEGPEPAKVAKLVRFLGFNSVKIGYSAATELSALDNLVKAATAERLLVVLSWQSGRLEFAENATTQKWLQSLTFMSRRYKNNPRVIGLDLLDGPVYEQDTSTFPVWGVTDLEQQAAQTLGYNFADWRTAAAQGAVAVWAGNPNAIVSIQGGLYGTDLRLVRDRPLSLAQECLRSRVVYGTHDSRWYSSLYEHYVNAQGEWNPISAFDGLESAVVDAVSNHRLASESDEEMPQQAGQSYEEYRRVRQESAYYLDAENLAPVWLSEFGTATKAGNKWWDYTLRSLVESDASWFYGPLGSRKDSALGLINAASEGESSIVGWKLQDLIKIQQLSPLHPANLQSPSQCQFLEQPNFEAAKLGIGVWGILQGPMKLPLLVAAASATVLVCCVCCCLCKMIRRCCGRNKPAWMTPFSPRSIDVRDTEGFAAQKPQKNLWCCSCQRELPMQVPDRVANMLPASMTVDSKAYKQLALG